MKNGTNFIPQILGSKTTRLTTKNAINIKKALFHPIRLKWAADCFSTNQFPSRLTQQDKTSEAFDWLIPVNLFNFIPIGNYCNFQPESCNVSVNWLRTWNTYNSNYFYLHISNNSRDTLKLIQAAAAATANSNSRIQHPLSSHPPVPCALSSCCRWFHTQSSPCVAAILIAAK